MAGDPASGRAPRALRWALFLSVALNFALIGLIAGAIAKGPPDRTDAGPPLYSYARAMPEPHRDALRDKLRDRRGEWRGARDARRAQREAVAAALVAEPFDVAAVAALLAEERASANEMAGLGADLLVAQIAEMNAEERSAYAERILEGRRRGD